MRNLIAHVVRWVAWHAEGATIGEPSAPHARITVMSTADATASGGRSG